MAHTMGWRGQGQVHHFNHQNDIYSLHFNKKGLFLKEVKQNKFDQTFRKNNQQR
jgi:hypothetical protein